MRFLQDATAICTAVHRMWTFCWVLSHLSSSEDIHYCTPAFFQRRLTTHEDDWGILIKICFSPFMMAYECWPIELKERREEIQDNTLTDFDAILANMFLDNDLYTSTVPPSHYKTYFRGSGPNIPICFKISYKMCCLFYKP